jgi:repressor LexA
VTVPTPRQQDVLEFVEAEIQKRGFPPSVREIGEALGMRSSSTVHNHLAQLQKKGYLTRDLSKPRALAVKLDSFSGVEIERRPVRHVPLLGDVAAGTGVLAAEYAEETIPLPQDFTGEGILFMLRVRGDSMIDAGILDGDYVVVLFGVLGGENTGTGGEATVKTFIRKPTGRKVILKPENPTMEPMEFNPHEVEVYGKVVTVLRRL